MKRIFLAAMIVTLLGGCGKTGPTGPAGLQGDPGPIGAPGVGYSSVTIQPGPGDAMGKDVVISPGVGNMANDPTMKIGYDNSIANYSRILMKFDISQAGLPTDAVIVAAILTLWPVPASWMGGEVTCHVYHLITEWEEAWATWTAATSTTNWSNSGSDFVSTDDIGAFSVHSSTGPEISIHLDAGYVQNWFNVNGNNPGIVIKSDVESAPTTYMAFYSRDYATDPTKRPKLQIIYGRASQLQSMSVDEIRAQYKALTGN